MSRMHAPGSLAGRLKAWLVISQKAESVV
jgi:hypothetical protein